MSRIPANRVPLVDPRTGLISREWYNFFFGASGSGESGDGAEFAAGVVETTVNYTPDNFTIHLRCGGNVIVSLQSASSRDSILTITNAGTGTVYINARAGETIKNDAQLILAEQWSSVQLLPRIGGWDIV